MKKFLLVLTCVITLSLSFVSCEKEEKFDYSMADLCGGTWTGVAVKTQNKWVDITSYLYSDLQFSIRFYEDGSYYGAGYFGYGTGTYTASGKTIKTYVDGELYYTYTIISMDKDKAELTMSRGESSIDIRVKKKY